MARRTVVLATCDITGQELENPNVVKLDLGEGHVYTLDLADGPYNELKQALVKYTDAATVIKGRTVTPSASSSGSGSSSADPEIQRVRNWGRENGFDVPTHGRLPQELRTAYENAHANA